MSKTLVVLLLAGVLVLGAGTSQAAPKLVMSDTTYDFGYVPQNAHISHVFWLKSAGTDTLKIIKVTPGCGCTQTPIDKEALASKDSTRLEIIFNTGTYVGLVEKQPRVLANDTTAERIIHFQANVVTRPDSTYPVVVDPYKLDISQFGEKQRTAIGFSVRNAATQPLKLTMVSTTPEYFTVELPKVVEPGKSVDGMVKLTPLALTKDFEKSFTFQVGDERQSRFTVPVKRTMRQMQSSTTPATPAQTH
ncbi:MAG: DUF1573 domain-containing protein [Candidatus Zixiibacteriota bacterium]